MKFSVITIFALISLTAAVKDFQPKNADDAENLTKDFEKLTPESPCNDGDQACVKDQFAQCVGGKFALTPCAGGTKCVVLPLVNKPGTSITCSTEEDRQNRLAEARGETPGQSNQPKNKDDNNVKTPDQPQNPENDKGDNNEDQSGKGKDDPKNFRPKNADDAEKLTKDFEKLTPDSPCNDGDQACVNDEFAQCVGGKFASTPCAGGTKCVVLPLVNKPGTSITCSTEEDRQNRLAEARGETPGQPKGNDNKPKNDKRQQPNSAEIRRRKKTRRTSIIYTRSKMYRK